jgi:hypothetical protein
MSNTALYSRRASECERRAAKSDCSFPEVGEMWLSLRDSYLFLLRLEERKEADAEANRW